MQLAAAGGAHRSADDGAGVGALVQYSHAARGLGRGARAVAALALAAAGGVVLHGERGAEALRGDLAEHLRTSTW